ncbi:heterokaryon incompatibility protein-domain-containing protein [Hyaloscypha finlandica]|nr:heterokaryon incompatibility protein-domain-containing protein [Hyaloscypha finlandica]
MIGAATMDLVEDDPNSLCDTCKRLCRGHWCLKSYEHPSDASHWVQVESWDEDIVIESRHHVIGELLRSTQKGCRLCAIIQGMLLQDEISKLLATEGSLHHNTARTTYELRPRGSDVIVDLVFHSGDLIIFRELLLTPTGAMFPTQCTSLISQETLSDNSLSQASQWLHECETDHAVCNPEIAFSTRRSKILPTRLLDVGTESSPTTKIINSNEFPAGVEYFTLSHFWGGKLPIKLTSDSLDEFQTAIQFPTLPRTFQEAIYITRLLKTRYLWIDAMCIIQDSVKDWLHESSIMGQVYANSRLTLAATASSDSHGGLCRQRNSRLIGAIVISPLWTGLGMQFQQYICTSYEEWRNDVDAAPLQKRGWVLQERMLSPRVLHFADRQLFWECWTKCASESIPTQLPHSVSGQLKKWPIGSMNCLNNYSHRLALQAKWPGIVAAYSNTALTNDKDKLVAISGIAKQMLEMWGGSPRDYLVGLWRDSIHHELLWRVDLGARPVRPKYNRAPSWSWASLDAEILVPSLYTEHLQVESSKCLVNIAEVKVTPSNNLSTSISKGHIRLQGPMCRMRRVVELTVDPSEVFRGRGQLRSQHWKIDGRTMPGFETYMDDGTFGSKAYGIQTYHFVGFFESVVSNPKGEWLTGMILQPTGGADGEYQRCGVLNVVNKQGREMINAAFAMQRMEKLEYEEVCDGFKYTIRIK